MSQIKSCEILECPMIVGFERISFPSVTKLHSVASLQKHSRTRNRCSKHMCTVIEVQA